MCLYVFVNVLFVVCVCVCVCVCLSVCVLFICVHVDECERVWVACLITSMRLLNHDWLCFHCRVKQDHPDRRDRRDCLAQRDPLVNVGTMA